MQDETYRECLIDGINIMQRTIHYLFCCGMDFACAKELAGVIEVGECFDLPVDILTTMEDPLIKEMGVAIAESWPLVDSLKNINNISEDEVWQLPTAETIDRNAPQGEQCSSFEEYYQKQIELIIDYLQTEAICVLGYAEEMLKLQDGYDGRDLTSVILGDLAVLKQDNDINISLFAQFKIAMDKLEDYLQNVVY